MTEDNPVRMILPLAATDRDADHRYFGGKAASLSKLIHAGFRVPEGAVLTSEFFTPWLRSLRGLGASAITTGVVMSLPMNDEQRHALVELDRMLPCDSMPLLAVRSSAIDEDSVDASFAGIYETILGVTRQELENAIRRCFSAIFHPKALAYRNLRGADDHPNFAILVQRQLDSVVSGVGFSLDPVSNDYDRAVIEANFGLGVSVVDGRSDPDRFLIDKVDGSLLKQTHGRKQMTVRLAVHGGTFEHHDDRADMHTLTESQLEELTRLICRVEALFDCPVDIEWAYADATLHLLQARPITAHVPLPYRMLTPPGERRRLYMDASLSKGMTSNRAFSVLGLDQVSLSFHCLIEQWLGPVRRYTTPDGLIFFAGGRMYVNLSDLLWLTNPKRLATGHAATDTLTAEILANVDAKVYRSAHRPAWLGPSLLWRLPRLLWRIRGLFGYLALALVKPDALHARYVDTSTRLIHVLRSMVDSDLPLSTLQQRMTATMADAFAPLMAALIIGNVSPGHAFSRRQTSAKSAELDALQRGTVGNVVVEMNIAMQRIAKIVGAESLGNPDALAERLLHRTMPAEMLDAWDAFIRDYGWRGPNEMDIASPRYGDQPQVALRQMAHMVAPEACDLETLHAAHRRTRTQALTLLRGGMGAVRRQIFDRLVRLNDLFAGARDTPKHINVLCNFVIRQRALREGERLVASGQLGQVEQVFDLTFEDLRDAALDPGLDLQTLRLERTAFQKRVETQVSVFPPVIDSRGRMLRPPERKLAPGLLQGMPVSAGLAKGLVRIVHRVEDIRIEPGEILVAYTTDPGWTPLFANAAAIVLEVGGVLQHGAIVAREFGKPCVVGISGVVSMLVDGELVEVDGAAGTVQRLSFSASYSD